MQLLISVKNVPEALIALEAGADIIDLKDPNVGALGALDLETTQQIVHANGGRGVLSATVGEQHASVIVLVEDIQARADLGVDMIKIAVSELFYAANFQIEMSKLTTAGVKIVAVFFAEEKVDLKLFEFLQKIEFYGAMLDTKTKRQNLLQLQTENDLQVFTQTCKRYDLKSGLAGSLQPQHIANLVNLNPTYIGFRGGVCENLMRNSVLSEAKVIEAKKLLR